MKTIKTLKLAAVLAAFFCILSFSSKAQIPGSGPYYIINNTNCAIDLRWSVLDGSGVSCLASAGFVSVPAYNLIVISNAMINSSCGGTTTNIFVGVRGTTLGGLFGSYYQVDSGTPSLSGTETDCNAASYNYSFNWYNNFCIIN